MYYTYILKSVNFDRFYVGSTEDTEARLIRHNKGEVTSTKPYLPWKLVYYEAHLTKTLARKAELFYKTGQGRRQIKRKLGLTEEVNDAIVESEDNQ
jgi:putative endonuclease